MTMTCQVREILRIHSTALTLPISCCHRLHFDTRHFVGFGVYEQLHLLQVNQCQGHTNKSMDSTNLLSILDSIDSSKGRINLQKRNLFARLSSTGTQGGFSSPAWKSTPSCKQRLFPGLNFFTLRWQCPGNVYHTVLDLVASVAEGSSQWSW